MSGGTPPSGWGPPARSSAPGWGPPQQHPPHQDRGPSPQHPRQTREWGPPPQEPRHPQGWGPPGPARHPQDWGPSREAQPQPQPWPQPAAPGQDEPRPSAATLLAVTAWRLAVGGAALSFAAGGKDETMAPESLSYLSNVGVGIGFLALAAYPLLVAGRRHEPRSAWLRGALTVMMVLVATVFIGGMGGEADGPHAVTPALVVVDWLFVGRAQFRTRWWEPPTWIAFLLAYLFYHRANDLGLYPDILGEDQIGTMVPVMLGFSVVLAYVLHGAALLRRSVTG